MKSPLKWHSQPGKNKGLLETLETTKTEVIFRSEDRDLVVKENSVLPCNGALYSKKIVEKKIYGCNMVVGPYVQTLALCVCEEGEGVQHFYWQEITCPASLLKNSSRKYSDVVF